MSAWISVLTCARRKESYLEQTIASLERGGAATFIGRKVIYIDGPVASLEGRFPGWELESVGDGASGARAAMIEIMRRAVAAGVEVLLYFEDDVVVCRNAIRAMLEIGVPEPLGFACHCDILYKQSPALELRAIPGCPRERSVADGGYNGCQALVIPRRTLERLATWTPPAWLEPQANNCDAVMGMVSDVFGVYHGLAQHVGDHSAITGARYGRVPQASGWQGEDFDADTVPRTYELNTPPLRCSFHVGVVHPDGLTCPRT